MNSVELTFPLATVSVSQQDAPWVSCVKLTFRMSKKHNALQPFVSRSSLSRVIFLLSGKTLSPYHTVINVNGNLLDCTRGNLEQAPMYQINSFNSTRRTGTSKFIGVSLDKRHNKWRAQHSQLGNCTYIGLFNTELEAARAYDRYVVANRRNAVHLNFPTESLLLKEILG